MIQLPDFTQFGRAMKQINSDFEKISKAMEFHKRNAAHFDAAMKGILSNAKAFDSSVKQLFEVNRKIAESVKIDAEVFKKVGSFQVNLLESVKKLVEGHTRFQTLMVSLGWFVPGEWDNRHANAIIKLHSEGKIKEIDQEICAYFSNERLIRFLKKWHENKSVNPERLKIIKEAIQAHAEDRYVLSIPVLLIQIEGLIRDYLNDSTEHSHDRLIKQFGIKARQEAPASVWRRDYLTQVEKEILEKVFCNNGVRRKTKEVWFTRHSTIHGWNLKDYNQTISTKLILLADFVMHRKMVV